MDTQENMLVDFETAQRSLMLDREAIVTLLKQFLAQREQYLSLLKSALSDGEWDTLKSQAHRLKGAAVNLRVYGIKVPAQQLEEYAKSHSKVEAEKNIALIEERFAQLETLITGKNNE